MYLVLFLQREVAPRVRVINIAPVHVQQLVVRHDTRIGEIEHPEITFLPHINGDRN